MLVETSRPERPKDEPRKEQPDCGGEGSVRYRRVNRCASDQGAKTYGGSEQERLTHAVAPRVGREAATRFLELPSSPDEQPIHGLSVGWSAGGVQGTGDVARQSIRPRRPHRRMTPDRPRIVGYRLSRHERAWRR